MGEPAGADADDVFGAGRLEAVLADVMRDTGASVGLMYLRVPGEDMLRLALVSGVSQEIAAPWVRIPADAPIPVVDAMRDRELVWLGGQQEIARRYPRLGIVLPYDFLLAAAPIADDDAVRGGAVLLWPVWHPPHLDGHERAALDDFGRRAARLLRRAAEREPASYPSEPRVVHPDRPPEADPVLSRSALRFAERLPVGCCAMDLDGRLTFLNTAAAELLQAGAAALLGKRPWEALLWLNDPVFEDRYRAAVVSRQPVSFTVARRPATRLLFELYPDATGISVHITRVAGPATTDEEEGEGEGRAAGAGATVPHGTPAPSGTPAPAPAPAGISTTHGVSAAYGTSASPGVFEASVPSGGPAPTPRHAEPVGAGAVYHLMHMAATLAEAAGVHDVVELVADQIVPAFGPQGLVLMSADEGRLRIIGHRGYRQEFVDRYDGTPLTAEVADAQVLATGVPVFFTSPEDLYRAHPHAPRYEDRSAWAFLPLIASGRPVGSLILSYARPRSFPAAERAMLTSLAGLIAQALARARLYDAKHSLARSLQTSLLPHGLLPLPGVGVAARYLPAGHGMDVGGDFYDLIRAAPDTVIAVIGDVQGHDPNAAALMGQVRTAVHAHATAGASPGDILARTNRLLNDLDPDRFTSCLIVELDLARHRLRLATAGHPPPLLRAPDGRTRLLEVPPGLLLGIAPDVEYATAEVPWEAGSVLALYTDGLVEAPGVDIGTATAELSGRLARSRPGDLDALADGLIRHVKNPAHRTDDVALLLLRREP
ncbi:PP2C family protein-serine/threonine phosphatase [Streptomyces sp. NPDC056488]|uniref:PP2C family protein-serine/threonine phosphatase n=1 Tax=Streptomyces sp. NPDC056488 TaxID=3345836 RepID=UPI003683E890